MQTSETLEYAGRRRRFSARAWIVIGVAAAVVASTIYLVERREYSRESSELAACAARADAVIDRQLAAIVAFAACSRSTLTGTASGGREEIVYQVISDFAAGRTIDLSAARNSCTQVRVLPIHFKLKSARRSCITAIAKVVAYIRSVVADGSNAYADKPPVDGCESAP